MFYGVMPNGRSALGRYRERRVAEVFDSQCQMYSAVIAYEGVVAMTYVIAETCIGKKGVHGEWSPLVL